MNAQNRFFKEKVIVTRDEEEVTQNEDDATERAERDAQALTNVLFYILSNHPQRAQELLQQLADIISQLLDQTRERIQERETRFNFR